MHRTYAATVKDGQLELPAGVTLPDGEVRIVVEVREATAPAAGDPADELRVPRRPADRIARVPSPRRLAPPPRPAA